MTNPDIIFIVLDTQRADRLGCYGYSKNISPHLDQFSSRAILFEQAVAPAQWTVPSHASMFTGEYPTTHQVTQSAHRLSPQRPHLAEILRAANYNTVGFCNNPLVGILNNGFKRGFDTFYNYGGAFPSLPQTASPLPWPFNKGLEAYTQFLRKISYPIQNFFGKSDLAFRVSLNAWLTPLWSKMANFKGQNERSVNDVIQFLQQQESGKDDKPLFLFLNLMETHLPFWPPGEFIDKTAPYFRYNKEARTLMRTWNREAYRWAAPLAAPLSELEAQVLSDLYDAEVAYQDHYLGQLLTALNGRSRYKETLTVIAADHGDGLGEHGYMGHAFVGYEELIHVPMIMHWPAKWQTGQRISTPISTRRIFHTILDAVGRLPENVPNFNPIEAHRLTLQHAAAGDDPENGTAFSEIYPPLNFVKALETRQPKLLADFRCLALRRAVVQQDTQTTHKLIHIDENPAELFDLPLDPLELENVHKQRPSTTSRLDQEIKEMVATAVAQRDQQITTDPLDQPVDEQLTQRLRGLGYID
ncbi:MAG: sulfatase [Anaerolineales bacterium]|nr:sulfatase [Anaerolineales bacterium]